MSVASPINIVIKCQESDFTLFFWLNTLKATVRQMERTSVSEMKDIRAPDSAAP